VSQAKADGKGGRREAAAARSEKSPKGKTLKFKGLTVKLPPTLPDTLLFDMAEIEAAGENPMPVFRMLRSVLGPEQFGEVRAAVEAGTIKVADLDDFITQIFGKYGLSPGES
jgi:hypothetical protein